MLHRSPLPPRIERVAQSVTEEVAAKKDQGEHGRRGGAQGDLFVDIRVRPHERFERRGADVLSAVPASYSQAVLGGRLEVETLSPEWEWQGPAPNITSGLGFLGALGRSSPTWELEPRSLQLMGLVDAQ